MLAAEERVLEREALLEAEVLPARGAVAAAPAASPAEAPEDLGEDVLEMGEDVSPAHVGHALEAGVPVGEVRAREGAAVDHEVVGVSGGAGLVGRGGAVLRLGGDGEGGEQGRVADRGSVAAADLERVGVAEGEAALIVGGAGRAAG